MTDTPRVIIDHIERAHGDLLLEGVALWGEPPPLRPRVVATLNGEPAGVAAADLSRPDAAQAGSGGARCGYQLRVPDPLPGRRADLELTALSADGRSITFARPLAPVRATTARSVRSLRLALERSVPAGATLLDLSADLQGTELERLYEVVVPVPLRDGLPYADRSFDAVVLGEDAPVGLAEAQRVAAKVTVTLAGGMLGVLPVAPPHPRPGRVSAVMAAYGSPELTRRCVERLLVTHADVLDLEVVVVDDCSPDDTWETLLTLEDPRLRLLRNPENLGYIRTINRAAAEATGEILVFVNNDCEVREGAIEALVRTLDEHPEAGAVGAKLLFPDGGLQEAGSAIFADGSASQIGRWPGARPDHPLYEIVRPVDYASAALMASPRSVFEQIGGFHERYVPAYYDDTDFCMAVRDLGRTVLVQPAAIGVHHEGVSSGTDVSTGVKQHQVLNHSAFLRRWRDELAGHGENPHLWGLRTDYRMARNAASLAQGREVKRALLVCDLPPAGDRDGASGHALTFLRVLEADGYLVTVVAEGGARTDELRARTLGQQGVEVHIGPNQGYIGAPYLERREELLMAAEFDLVVIQFWSLAERWLPLVREHCPEAPVILDMVDLHLLRLLREKLGGNGAIAPGRGLRSRDAHSVADELNAYAAADAVLSVSPLEAGHVDLLCGRPGLAHVLPLGRRLRDPDDPPPTFADRAGMLFVGNFNHPPNREALEFLVAEILPLLDPDVRREHPLYVVGYRLGDELARWCLGHLDVVPVGWVPSLAPYLDLTRAFVAPLQSGAGVKNKVLDALGAGLPCVTTPVGVEGMSLIPGRDVLVADSPADAAAALHDVLTDHDRWRMLSAAGLEWMGEHHSLERMEASFRGAIAATDRSLVPDER